MAFFDNFPYTNFHRLNLDWIIKQIKENKATIESFTAEVEAMGISIEEFRAYIESIDQEIHTHVVEEVTAQVPPAIQEEIESGGFDQVLTEARKRRFVFVGDSYAEGYNPDGNVTGFPDLIKEDLNIPTDDYFNIHKGGARFGAASGNEYAFDTVLGNNIANISDPETITDLVFTGGYNDSGSSSADITAGIERCKTIIASHFTNPSLRVWLFGMGYNCLTMATRAALFNVYTYAYAKSGWAFTRLTPAICAQGLWSSDGYHPTADCQTIIAKNIENILNGGTEISHVIAIEYGQTGITNVVLWTRQNEGFFTSCLFSNANIPEDNITLSNNTPVTIFEVTTGMPLANQADVTRARRSNVHAIVKLSDNSYREVDLICYLEQTARTTFACKAVIYNLNDAGNNYLTLENVTEIQMIVNSLSFIIPFDF